MLTTQPGSKLITIKSVKLHVTTEQGVATPHEDIHMIDTTNRTERRGNIFNRVTQLYVNYVKRLWKETNTSQRRRIAKQEATNAILRVQHYMEEEEEYMDVQEINNVGEEELKARMDARHKLLDACSSMLELQSMQNLANDSAVSLAATSETTEKTSVTKKKKKKSRSVFFGAAMGAIVALWVFSGNYVFTGLFTLMTALGQLEYYRMVMNAGVFPARKISVVGACAMFITALFAPNLHQICLPVFATYAMIWFLTMRRKVSSIAEIATTFTGMFYLGYIPSFWVRIRCIGGGLEPTRLDPLLRPIFDVLGRKATSLPSFLPKYLHLPITTGAIFIFWAWISIAFSDVGAYFVGRKYGRTKLDKIAPAAGAASPNKTVEGYLGGSIVCAMFATTGAWVMRWPYWFLTGPIHGFILSFLGLVGDLTASMLKRDANLKDFGDILPEHGGIMDRVDSFIFTAPYSWLVCQFIIPALKLRGQMIPI